MLILILNLFQLLDSLGESSDLFVPHLFLLFEEVFLTKHPDLLRRLFESFGTLPDQQGHNISLEVVLHGDFELKLCLFT